MKTLAIHDGFLTSRVDLPAKGFLFFGAQGDRLDGLGSWASVY
jgi:hypothetical protein